MAKQRLTLCRLAAIVLSCFLTSAAASSLGLFSVKNSAEKNRLAIITRYGQWMQQYHPDSCEFKIYQGVANPIFFLQWFLGTKLESRMQYAQCDDGYKKTSHILLEVWSPTRPKQKFTIGIKSVAKSAQNWPYYSETTYASKSSFIMSVEENKPSKTIFKVHHRYRSEPAELESGEIQHPQGLQNKAHTYASLMTYISDLVGFNDAFRFVLTDPYSAAVRDELVEYPMWRNEPVQVIKARRNKDNSITMQGWLPYAFGQLYADINLCFGRSKIPDLINYRHPFMDVDLWRSSATPPNQCKIEYDKAQARKQRSESFGSKNQK